MKTFRNALTNIFEKLATKAVNVTGSPGAFIVAVLIIIVWALTGPIFKYSDAWQLVINTGTTIITFLMVFLIQKAQNKDSKSIQLKLNELIAVNKLASNRLIDAEDLTEEELNALHKYYSKMVEVTREKIIRETYSTEKKSLVGRKTKRKTKNDSPVPVKGEM